MILSHQPDCFTPDVLVRVSSRSDGTVLDRAVGIHNPAIVTNRTAFCAKQGVSYGDVVYQRIVYGDAETYDRIVEVGRQHTCTYISEVAADALITAKDAVGLLLPIGDCVATVIHDPESKRLALLHLGRHSTVAGLMIKTLRYLIDTGSNAADVVIWMAPSVKQTHYRMEYFDTSDDPLWQKYAKRQRGGVYLDLQGYNRAAAESMGVLPEHIHESPHNTAVHPEYFSHSHGDITGRFAVLAMIRSS